MLSVKEVASRLDVHPATVYRWIKAGKIPAFRYGSLIGPHSPTGEHGGSIRVPLDAIEAHKTPELTA